MNQQTKPDRETSSVFFSHSSLDKPFVRRLATDLEAQGIKCWIDEAEIRPGDDFVSRIEEGLSKATHVFIVLSEHSIISSWVREEAHAAQIRAIHGHTRLIPILLGALKSDEIPLLLQSRLYVDFRDPARYQDELLKLFSAFQLDIVPSTVESAKILQPRIEDGHILQGTVGSGYAVEILLTNPSPARHFVREVIIGALQPDHAMYAVSPPRYTYQLNLQLGASSDEHTMPVSGTANEPGDDWGRPATGYLLVSGGRSEFEVSCPFYMELEPKDRTLVRFVFRQPNDPTVTDDRRRSYERHEGTYKLLEDSPEFGKSVRWGGYSWIILNGDFEAPIGARINDNSLLRVFRSTSLKRSAFGLGGLSGLDLDY
jgi:hypothetical protein